MDATRLLISALANPVRYPHPVERIEVIETHISYVVLTGRFAYKIKKPVNLGFLDFTALEARRFYCQEELRLNRRLAPELYLDVVTITGTPEAPALDGDGVAIEYAVKMREFPQEALLDRRLAAGQINGEQIDRLATIIAGFHQRIAVAPGDSTFGDPHGAIDPARENFRQIRPLLTDLTDFAALEQVEQATERAYAALQGLFEARRRDGFIRECHGDLHLGNIATFHGQLLPFDCIEFNENLRWIDVISEVAFLVMDLQARARPDLAYRFLNRYLERTGDYAGVKALHYYCGYRAMVRAKIAMLRAHQPNVSQEEQGRDCNKFHEYLARAQSYFHSTRPALIITHGVSGCGKTFHTQALLERIGAIRLRSDIERKRLQGLPGAERSQSELAGGWYSADATERTYRRLTELARAIVGAGYPVIVDATFLKRAQRQTFRALAAELAVPFSIVSFKARIDTLRERILNRLEQAQDASEADLEVLEFQLMQEEPLGKEELRDVVEFDSEAAIKKQELQWQPLLERLRSAD